ncbi:MULTISPECIES: helix-turn-helix transcriptional regulator [Bradyrhizobium]|uniref:helix-turn-helix transcriptional regulator n=1 Tax=Bradyrhizobium TaxID=374 RepID=UPI00056E603A|nr:AlpA family phage regulatory protein [Bradyrhizobium elkanii]WLA85596.1 AlpA family phage regulatory protein [Bradyrhizobium elkanii]
MSGTELAKRVCAKYAQKTPEAITDQHDAETKNDVPNNSSRPRRMMSEAQVLTIVPVGRSTLWRMEKAGRFPRSTYISPNRRVWFEDEIVAWQSAVDEFNADRGRGKGRRRGASPAVVNGKMDKG